MDQATQLLGVALGLDHELFRCVACNSCTKVCPMDVEAFCKYPERKELVQIAGENRSI